jgi:hypothetical protein
MEFCEVCKKEKTYRELTEDQKKIFEKMHIPFLRAWVYICQCPQFLLNEIWFIRQNNLKIDDDTKQKIMSLFNQKKSWIINKELNFNNYMKTWERAMVSDIKKEPKTGKEYQANKSHDSEVIRIHGHLWQILYKLKGE